MPRAGPSRGGRARHAPVGPDLEGSARSSWFLGSDALLRTVHRGERRLLSAYDRNLLRADLPEPLVDLLRKQRVQLAENVGNIGLFLRNGLLLADH